MEPVDDPELAQAASEAEAARAAMLAPGQVVTRASTMLRMVRQGVREMHNTDQDRILFGFLGVAVLGRSMTLVMQNLRTYDQDAFDRWYAPWQAEMKDDPLMRYFLRSPDHSHPSRRSTDRNSAQRIWQEPTTDWLNHS